MAKVNLNTIKNWFRTGLKPTQNQFWDTWDSFWHKDEVIPITKIDNIENILNEKTDVLVFTQHLSNEEAHSTLFNTKVDKKSGWNLTQENFSPELKEKLENLNLKSVIEIIEIEASELSSLDTTGITEWLNTRTDLELDPGADVYIKITGIRTFTNEFSNEFS